MILQKTHSWFQFIKHLGQLFVLIDDSLVEDRVTCKSVPCPYVELLGIGLQHPLDHLLVVPFDRHIQCSLTLVVALLKALHSCFHRLGTRQSDGCMCDLVLDTLQVLLLDALMDGGVFNSVQKGIVLFDLRLEPFPDLSFEVRLPTETQGLARVRLDSVQGSAVIFVAGQSQPVFKHVFLYEIVFFIRDRAKGQTVHPGISIGVRKQRVTAKLNEVVECLGVELDRRHMQG